MTDYGKADVKLLREAIEHIHAKGCSGGADNPFR